MTRIVKTLPAILVTCCIAAPVPISVWLERSQEKELARQTALLRAALGQSWWRDDWGRGWHRAGAYHPSPRAGCYTTIVLRYPGGECLIGPCFIGPQEGDCSGTPYNRECNGDDLERYNATRYWENR